LATQTSIFHPNSDNINSAPTTGTSTAEIVIGKNRLFAINADQDVYLAFGNAGMSAASTANWRLPANVIATFDLADAFDRIRAFNNSASTANIAILFLSRG